MPSRAWQFHRSLPNWIFDHFYSMVLLQLQHHVFSNEDHSILLFAHVDIQQLVYLYFKPFRV